MFFPDKIKSIKENDRVLEIGPGGFPYPRADAFLDLKIEDEKEAEAQRGHAEKPFLIKPVFYYNGHKFPFRDKEFDYVICSHVIEHVDDVELFLSEMFRVASKGYIEYPTIYYEYLYNFHVHLNFIKYNNDNLFYYKKNKTHFSEFIEVHRFFCETLSKGYVSIVDDLKDFMFEGFEWLKPFSVRETSLIDDLVWKSFKITPHLVKPYSEPNIGIINCLKRNMLKLIKR